MKKELTGMAKKTMLKKIGWKLLLMLAAFIWSAVMPAVSSAEWTIEAVDTPKNFSNFYQRVIAIDSSDHPHISYGGEHLYYAYFDGTQWQDEVVDNAPRVGQYTSIAIDSNDNVHISYWDQTNYALKYATNASGLWVIEALDTEGNVGRYTSIAIDSNNNVHISYHDSTNFALKYATNASGTWVIKALDTEGFVGSDTSIAIDSNDNVHISYYDAYSRDLKYATNASDVWVIETIDTEGQVGEYTSIAIDSNDNVHISYYDWTNDALKYATNASGTWVIETLVTGRKVGLHTSIAIDSNDNVHISYYGYSDSTDEASFRYATNASGVWVLEAVNSSYISGTYSSIAIDSNDNVHIIYYDWIYSDLKYATNISGDWVIEIVDTEGFVGAYTSIAIDSNNNMHISYYDVKNDALKYATNSSGVWVIETIDNEGQVGQYTSIAIDSNDNLHISYYGNGDLKYATNASGTWVLKTIDTKRVNPVGMYTSIAIDSNDNVHISYQGNTGNLKYATNTSGIWVIETVDTYYLVGSFTSIAIDSNDNVHISYQDDYNRDLKYATNSSGTWVIETIDTEDGVGMHTSIVIDSNDNVHISYQNAKNGDLKYATNASGLWVIEIVDTEGHVGRDTSIAIDSSNNVHISYYDLTNENLKYATNTSGTWALETVDAEGSVGAYTSIAIDSNDNLHISYGEWDYYSLKHATNSPGVQIVSAKDAYDVLTTDPTAVMLDTRTVDEHNGYCQPWDQDCGGQINTDAAYAGTPQWAVNGIEKLPITLPYWYAGINRNTGPPEDEAQTRNIIEGALAANAIDFDTPIYLISSTAYRSYHMTAWMKSQTFTNPVTYETSSFTNLFNIDSDVTANDGQGGMQEWIAADLPTFDGTIVPPQVFSVYPEDGYIKTNAKDLIFAAGVLEPTTGGFVYPDVEVLLYVDGSDPVSMTQVDEAVIRAFFSISDGVFIPGRLYMATKNLPGGIHAWNVKAINSSGISWNLNVLNGSVQGPGQRTLTVVSYTITATAGSDGSISPSGDVIVDAGSDQTFTITPQRGYQVSDVLVDGVSIGRVISYTFTNVSSNHTISAEFTKRGMRRKRGRGRR